MRISVTGSHRVGKSTLVAALAAQLPEYEVVEEPYHRMAEDGLAFSHPPSEDDFRAQLEYWLDGAAESSATVLYDRSAVDLLGYLACVEPRGLAGLDHDIQVVRPAVESLDLVVYVPIETPDRISPSSEPDYEGLREDADAALRGILDGGIWDVDLAVLEVRGTVEDRLAAVLEWLDGSRQARSRGLAD